jgi:hypothetical protein
MSTDAEKFAFNTGYLLACCNIVNLHDQPGIAYDVLAEAGITRADVKAMDLCEYDAEALKIIRKERPTQGDPISRNRKKGHDVIACTATGKGGTE